MSEKITISDMTLLVMIMLFTQCSQCNKQNMIGDELMKIRIHLEATND